MLLKEAVRIIKGRLLYDEGDILNREYYCAIASDLMSNVMVNGEEDSILITSLVNPQVIRASEMMNITCIIITCGKSVTDTMIELAKNRNIALVETEDTTFTVCGKLHSRGMQGRQRAPGKPPRHVNKDRQRAMHGMRPLRKSVSHRSHKDKRHEGIRKRRQVYRVRDVRQGMSKTRRETCCGRNGCHGQVRPQDSYTGLVLSRAVPDVKSRNHLLTALKRVGFDDVYEEAIGAEMVSYATRMVLKEKKRPLPVISSACPAILKLIQIRFPNLIDNVLDYRPPVEITAGLARKEAEASTAGTAK